MSGIDEKPVVLYPTECGCGYLALESICAECGNCVDCCVCNQLEPEQCQGCGSYYFVRTSSSHNRIICDVESHTIVDRDDTTYDIGVWECFECGARAPLEAEVILDRMI